MRIVEKGWGREEIFADTDKYCGKLLCFKAGRQSSMHFHREKDETWLCLSGDFTIDFIDTTLGTVRSRPLHVGDSLRIEPACPHRIRCLTEGVIVEVSTRDSVEDNYRISPGDSQK